MGEEKCKHVITLKGKKEILEGLRSDLLRNRADCKSERRLWLIYLFISLTYASAVSLVSSTSMPKVDFTDCFTCQLFCVQNDAKRSESIQEANKTGGTRNVQLHLQGNFTIDWKSHLPTELVEISREIYSGSYMQKVNLYDCFTCQLLCRRNYTKRSKLIQEANKTDGTRNVKVQLQGILKSDWKFHLPSKLVLIPREANKTGRIRSVQVQLPGNFTFSTYLEIHLPSTFVRIRRDTDQIKGAPIYGTEFPDGKSVCKFPGRLNTAETLCKMWPESVTCISYCIYGHTYREGISRTHSCSYKKDKWTERFEECTPFVDCKVKLIAPGDLKCMYKEITESPRCEISCERYEDKDATNMKMYECKLDGKWEPALPHCAEVRGTYLASVPQVTKHREVTFPKKQGIKNKI